MKKCMMWLFMLFKRQMKKISLYVILLVMVIICVMVKYVADNFLVTIKIGVCNNDNTDTTKRLEESLYNHKGLIVFEKYDTEKKLKEDVQKGVAMGGYVISKDFSERLISDDNDNVVKEISTPNSFVISLSKELFFSYMMREISYEKLVEDTISTGLFDEVPENKLREKLKAYFEENLSNGSTFHVDYDRGADEFESGSFKIDTFDYISPIIEGIVGLMVFIGGLCGTINYFDDRDKGSLILLRRFQKFMVKFIEILIPILIVSAVGIAILFMTGMSTDIGETLMRYVIYAFIVLVYCMILEGVMKKKIVFVSFIPVLVLMSLVFCPVFVNIESFAGKVSEIGKLLPLYWCYVI